MRVREVDHTPSAADQRDAALVADGAVTRPETVTPLDVGDEILHPHAEHQRDVEMRPDRGRAAPPAGRRDG